MWKSFLKKHLIQTIDLERGKLEKAQTDYEYHPRNILNEKLKTLSHFATYTSLLACVCLFVQDYKEQNYFLTFSH